MIEQLRVGTFNLFNLALPNTNYYSNREYSLGKYKKKARWINEQLRKMQADIVGFQEIFHEEAIRGTLSRNTQYQAFHVLTTPPTGKRPVVGLASKFPIVNHEVITHFPEQLDLLNDHEAPTTHVIPLSKFSRPILRADIQVHQSLVVSVFVVHLKSKRPIYPKGVNEHHPAEKNKGAFRALIRRASEANALRQIFIQHRIKHPSYPVIVLGDFNDTGAAMTSKLITGDRPELHQPPGVSYKEWMALKRLNWSVLLQNCTAIQTQPNPQDQLYTHIFNGDYESLDHILVSNEFAQTNKKRLGSVTQVQAFNDHLVDELSTGEQVPAWQSDHGQLVAHIVFNDK